MRMQWSDGERTHISHPQLLTMTFDKLRALQAIISGSINDIERIYTRASGPEVAQLSDYLDFPSLDDPYDPTSPAEALSSHPIVADAVREIIAAAGQLIASVQQPTIAMTEAALIVSSITA
jgi:hypothetical protein